MAEKKSSSSKSKKKSEGSDVSETKGRQKWGNKMQFILSCIGYSVGLGNVWRFSYLVYDNGGGAFLIPYIMAVLTTGLPLYVLELAIGQFGSLGPITAYRRMVPAFQGVGWAAVAISFNVAMYYNVIIAWIIYYMFESMRWELQWTTGCGNKWNTNRCGSIEEDKACVRDLNDSLAKWFAGACYGANALNDTARNGTWLNGTCINGTINNTLSDLQRLSPAEEFYRYYILDAPEHLDFYDLGTINRPMVGCMAAAWTLIFVCLAGGIQTSGKVVYFTSIFPYVVLLLLLILGATLEGAGKGIEYYLSPNMTRLGDPNVWRKAAVQVFYSLGQGQGGLTTLASFNEFDNDFIRDATIVSAVDSMTSLISGFATFSIIGYVAHLMETDVSKAVGEGTGLAFVVFPTAISKLTVPQFWCFIFFFMLLTLGLDSEFVLYETVTTALIDQIPSLAKHKMLVVGSGCLLCFLLGLPFCTRGGMTIFAVYDDYSSGYVVMLVALYETVVVCWVYGLGNFMKDIYRMRKQVLSYYWRVTWALIIPLYMVSLFIATIALYEPSDVFGKILPEGAQQLGWFLSSMPMLSLVGFATYRIVEAWQKKLPWESLISPTQHWCPAADLAKRSPARHEGSARMHLLDHPHHPRPPQDDEQGTGTLSSKLKSVDSGSKSHSVPSIGLGLI